MRHTGRYLQVNLKTPTRAAVGRPARAGSRYGRRATLATRHAALQPAAQAGAARTRQRTGSRVRSRAEARTMVGPAVDGLGRECRKWHLPGPHAAASGSGQQCRAYPRLTAPLRPRRGGNRKAVRVRSGGRTNRNVTNSKTGENLQTEAYKREGKDRGDTNARSTRCLASLLIFPARRPADTRGPASAGPGHRNRMPASPRPDNGPCRRRPPSLATHALTAVAKRTASARAMPSSGARGRRPGAGGSESRLGRPVRSSATEGARGISRVHHPIKKYPGLEGPPTQTITAGEGTHQPVRGRVPAAVWGAVMS